MATFVQQPCDELLIRSGDAVAPCPRASGPWILAATILGSSMAFIDGTAVNVALPALQQSLKATIIDVQWVVESYSLLLSALLLMGGSLGDHYGRRRIFIVGVAIFSLASAWCGFATSVRELIFARAMQGAGGALLVPGSLAIISASFRDEDRGRAIGTWSGFTAITAAIGPVLGGWLIEHVSWRAVFFINLPLAAIVLLICVSQVPESRDENQKEQLDWLGATLTTIGLGSIIYGLIESSRLHFGHPVVLTALIAGSRRTLLEQVFPGSRYAWSWHGHKCRAVDYYCHERGPAKSGGHRIGNQQRRVARSRAARHRGIRHRDVECVQSFARFAFVCA